MLRSPGYSSVMPIRSHLDAYRSLPSSPMPMDPMTLSGQDMALAMNQATMGLEASDYFHHPGRAPSPRYSGGIGSRSPYPGGYEPERITAPYEMELGSPELNHRINATNLAAQLANSQISATAKYGKIYPHLCEDGRYPTDFNVPKSVDTIRLLDNSQLDRIFQAYRLPVDMRPLNSSSLYTREGNSSSRHRQARVLTLFEYLGAWKIVEHDRLRRLGR